MGAELPVGACAGGLFPRGGWRWVAAKAAPTGAWLGGYGSDRYVAMGG